MRLNIQLRFFFALLLAILLVVGGMVALMQWSLQRGFIDYLNTQEQQRVRSLADSLVLHYAEYGDWGVLQSNRMAWRRLLHENRHQLRAATPADEPPRHLPLPFELRLALLDPDLQRVAGSRRAQDGDFRQALHYDGELIGYLSLVSLKELRERQDLAFMREQKLTFFWGALLMFAVAMLLSYPLASRLVHPIRQLRQATHRLTEGDYQVRTGIRRRDELGQLAEDFDRMAGTLARNEQLRRQWVADISHELRTPLGVLRGELEALQDGVRPLSADTLDSLHAEVMRLSRLVDDLHELSRADIDALDIRPQPLRLDTLLRGALENHRQTLTQRGIRLTTDVAENLCLSADEQRMQQVFDNLLTNSRRYTEQGGQLNITLREEQDQARLVVEDSGPGVANADLPRLFDRLYRADRSRNRAQGGSGLGLALCKAIIEAHGGTIHAAHSPLGGLAIQVSLPLHECP